jgi:hypothetical protein
VAPKFLTRRRTPAYEAVNATGVPFNECVNAINTRSFKRSLRAEQRNFFNNDSEAPFGAWVQHGRGNGLHQRGVITMVLARRSGAINTAYVHRSLHYRILHTITECDQFVFSRTGVLLFFQAYLFESISWPVLLITGSEN